jgi:hypothetical protein
MNDIEFYRQWTRDFDNARKSMAETLANDCGEVLRAIHAGLRGELAGNPADARLLGLCAGVTDVLDRKAQQFEAAKSQEPKRTYYVQVMSSPTGRVITYKSPFHVPVGSMVTLPPLPWTNDVWSAIVIGNGELSDGYHGEIKTIVSASIPR